MRTLTNKPAVKISNLSFSRSGNKVLDNVSLQINPGEHIALLGANGSGKSTLLELIIGTLKPDSGKVRLANRQIGFVPQRSAVSDLIPMTVRDAVEMGRWAKVGSFRPLKTSDRVIVDAQIERMGIEYIQHKQLSTLSGGQRQRTLIAQALAQETPLLLLDEPESGLDADAARTINSVLQEEAKNGVAVVIATHDTGSAMNAARCILLSYKTHAIAADGSPEEVLNDHVIAKSVI